MRYELHRGFFLAAQCANVSDEVNGQYVIGFYPETTNGKWHKLNVTVGGQQQRTSRSLLAKTTTARASEDGEIRALSGNERNICDCCRPSKADGIVSVILEELDAKELPMRELFHSSEPFGLVIGAEKHNQNHRIIAV